MWTLRHRAERAEAEQELRAAQSRSNERERIAREMHDVLAHRISQISMHAGALAFRDDLTADEMRESAGVIQAKAHEALTDLRGVLGVLRDEAGELTNAPQPTYADLPALVDEARESGMAVTLDDRLARRRAGARRGRPDDLPDRPGGRDQRAQARAGLDADDRAQRLARGRHRRGAAQPAGLRQHAPPAPGLGLVGLTERAELRGGRLEHGRDGVGVRPPRLDTVGGVMVTRVGRWSTTTRWSGAHSR